MYQIMETKTTQRLRSWCFTFNNYPLGWDQNTLAVEGAVKTHFGDFKYIVLGYEIGESGTPHIQGYVDFTNARTLGGIRRINQCIHWEPRRGSWDDASNYCMKGEQTHEEWVQLNTKGPNFGKNAVYLEFGTPNQQGKRTDLIDIKNEIVAGLRIDTIAMENPLMFHQYGRTLTKIEDIALRKNFRMGKMTEGIWYWGKTGVGKSHIAFQNYTPETHYLLPNDNGWWDAYTQQPIVIINDFRGEIEYNVMLQLIDSWPFSVKRRNREPMPFTSTKVIITSSLPPHLVFKKRNERDSIEQLLRRMTVFEIKDTIHSTEVIGGGNTSPPNPSDNCLPAAESGLENDISEPTWTGIMRDK